MNAEPTISAPRTRRRLFTRRRVLRAAAGGLLAGAGALGWAVGVEPHWVDVTRRTMRLAGLPGRLVGKRLVQVSDLHVGSADEGYLVRTLRRVNALQPDLIAFTGDLIDHGHAGPLADAQRVIGSLRPASVATFACLGNHDYGRNWAHVDVADAVAGVLAAAGVRVLRNEAMEVDGLTVVGLDDYWGPRFQPREALTGIDPSRDAICLCHNPDACDAPVWADFRGVILSGHTHGGQCKPPFLSPPLLPVRNRRYVAGDYDVGPGRRLYINRGIGHTLRARFNCRPEVTVFTLASA